MTDISSYIQQKNLITSYTGTEEICPFHGYDINDCCEYLEIQIDLTRHDLKKVEYFLNQCNIIF